MDDNTQTQTDWRESLPEQVRDWSEVQNADSSDVFWQRMGDQRKHIGNSIRIPTEDASTEDWAAFNQKIQDRVPSLMRAPNPEDAESVDAALAKLGRPEDASGYGEVTGEGVQFAEGQLESLKAMALKAGLTRTQFESLAKQVGADYNAQQETVGNLQNENLELLKSEWGLSAEGKYQETLNFAKAVGAPNAVIEGLETRSMQAETVMWLNKMAGNAKEANQVSFQQGTSLSGDLAPMEAQSRIDEILRNFDHPYHDGDRLAQQKMHDLMRQANPDRYTA